MAISQAGLTSGWNNQLSCTIVDPLLQDMNTFNQGNSLYNVSGRFHV